MYLLNPLDTYTQTIFPKPVLNDKIISFLHVFTCLHFLLHLCPSIYFTTQIIEQNLVARRTRSSSKNSFLQPFQQWSCGLLKIICTYNSFTNFLSSHSNDDGDANGEIAFNDTML
jgi:hypothetical protein